MERTKRKFNQYLLLVFNGFSMGAANVIPGVSGGTMAFIMGIYEELIDSIRQCASVNTFRKVLTFKIRDLYKELPWPFLMSISLGVMLAVASLARVLSYALDKYPGFTFSFFFGLIIASILTVVKDVKEWSTSRFLAIAAGAASAYLIVTLVPVETPHTWWNLFLCGIIIICAMILPGISGSFLLLILGQYKYVLDAVNNRQFMVLFWVTAGCVIGLGSFVHLLNWLFKKFHDLTVAVLTGFMIGSLWKLWPWQEQSMVMVKTGQKVFKLDLHLPENAEKLRHVLESNEKVKIKTLITENVFPSNIDTTFWLSVGLAAIGFGIVVAMEKTATKKNKV